MLIGQLEGHSLRVPSSFPQNTRTHFYFENSVFTLKHIKMSMLKGILKTEEKQLLLNLSFLSWKLRI